VNQKFGSMVILDPVWNLKSLQTNQEGEVQKVLLSLTYKLPGMRPEDGPEQVNPLKILQPSIEHALVCIVEAVAGISAAQYVNEFLDDYAGQMEIPRDAEFDL